MDELAPSAVHISLPIYNIHIYPTWVKVDEPDKILRLAYSEAPKISKETEPPRNETIKRLRSLEQVDSGAEDKSTYNKSMRCSLYNPDTVHVLPGKSRTNKITSIKARSKKGLPKSSSRSTSNLCVRNFLTKQDQRYLLGNVYRESIIDQSVPLRYISQTKEDNLLHQSVSVQIDLETPTCFVKTDVRDRGDAGDGVTQGSIPSIFIYNIDGYGFSYLVSELERSTVFRSKILQRYSLRGCPGCPPLMNDSTLSMTVFLKIADKGVLDYTGNQISNSFIVEKCELDVALSWLSTLGGAFSALGDNSTSYAAEAGRVSMTQLKIAMKLKDPLVASRCRLYAAISLLQRGFLKSARDIVKREYKYALSLPPDQDPRLKRMCFGIWAKLQYYWALSLMSKRGVDSFEEILQNWNEIRMLKNGIKSDPANFDNSTFIAHIA